jgi:salicylate 5-hydroxylase small subunit
MDTALRFEIEDLYNAYVACLDERRFSDWPEFFIDACVYKVVPRENYDRGLPLSTLSFESKGMLKDRVYGVTQTLFHAPYYQRHIVSAPQFLGENDGVIRMQANYLVIRTKQNQPSELFNAGRYLDAVVRDEGRLKFKEKLCIFDSELIPNSIIYPI